MMSAETKHLQEAERRLEWKKALSAPPDGVSPPPCLLLMQLPDEPAARLRAPAELGGSEDPSAGSESWALTSGQNAELSLTSFSAAD